MIARKESMRESYARRQREKGLFHSVIKRTPLRKASKKRASEGREYTIVSRQFLADNPTCQLCYKMDSSELHHMRGRAGRLLTDTRFFSACCSACHMWIHANPNKARELGLLAPANEWNVSPV